MPKKRQKPKKKVIKQRRKIFGFHHVEWTIMIASCIVIASSLTIMGQMQRDEISHTRAGRIDAYFRKAKAPLTGYGKYFVEAADNCEIGMDWRLLPAIAMRESTGGKRMQLNNPFGWGSAEIPYMSIKEAILDVGAHICGSRSSTAKWYATTSTREKLYYYNGTVLPSYPDEVIWIMEQI